MKHPDRAALYAIASSQEGYFTTRQAGEAGYSRPLLDHHLKSGRFIRAQRAVYRFVEYPAGEHEDLVVIWLWSDRSGVFSHETALALHDLSDALPSLLHITLPTRWANRRLGIADGVRAHFADLGAGERGWHGAVPVTTPIRTLGDCVADHVQPGILAQAVRDGIARGLFTSDEAKGLGVGP